MLLQKHIQKLIQEMTLSEKAAEMSQLWGENPDGTLMGHRRGFHMNKHLSENAGSLLGFNGAERVMEAQRLHLEDSAHHIPLLFMTDVIHGYKTAFPSVLGLGATWDPALAGDTASAAAAEAAAAGVHVTFSPMADLVRDARFGRVTESTGEDPYLNSLFTAAFVRGYQGDGIDRPGKIASCVKHFVGYGAVEGGRDYDSTQIGAYSLYNDYLPPFQAAIEAGCEMLMPGFHTLDGIPCTSNRMLLQSILRKELSFEGPIISDCTAVWELIAHGVCADQKEAAAASIGAGIDIEMVSTTFYENIEQLLLEGVITMAEIDASVERILTLKDKLGLFENPYKDASVSKEKELLLCKKHRDLAREAAARSLVLLKNADQTLPLQKTEKIALIGPLADSHKLIDIWGLINSEEKDCVSVKEAFGALDSLYAPGCSLWNMRHPDQLPDDPKLLANAVQIASQCDKIVLVLGEHPEMSSEAGSRAKLTLPANQLALLKALSETGKPIVSVIIAGRPLELQLVSDYSAGVLMAWFPGTEGGNGIADVLTGQTAPTGRLPMSFPRMTGQSPLYYNHLPTGRPNTSAQYESFKNGYIGMTPGPLYPFGYGLSYTAFSYSSLSLSKTEVFCPPDADKDTVLLTASVCLRNTGNAYGTETVQLYLCDVTGTYSRPVKMLKSFSQIPLAPYEETVVSFSITPRMLQYYIPGRGLSLEQGLFRVFIGADSGVNEYIQFHVTGGY